MGSQLNLTRLLLLLAFSLPGFSKPFLHEPNTECGVPTRLNQVCPVVCVRLISQCPPQLTDPAIAQCKPPKNVCVDGSCSSSCNNKDLTPVCSCPKSGFVLAGEASIPGTWLPCSLPSSNRFVLNVSYTQLQTEIVDHPNLPLWESCQAKGSFKIKMDNPTHVINECSIAPPTRTKNLLAPEFLIAYCIMTVEIFILFMHYLYKSSRERNFKDFRRNSNPMSPSTANEDRNSKFSEGGDLEMQDMISGSSGDPNIRFTGYQIDTWGNIASITCIVTSFLWVILLAVLVLDYYQVFSKFNFRNESDLLFNDHELLSTVFIVSWHFVTFWFLGLKLIQDKSESYFGRRVPLSIAQMVLVEKKMVEAVAIANMGYIAEKVRKLENHFRKWTGAEFSVSMVPVETTSGGRRYIEYECVRYVYDDRSSTFLPYTFKVGPRCSDLYNRASGLQTTEAHNRMELGGENRIAFPADTWYTAAFKEFTGLFYIYEMMSLWIWYYYAYYYMGLVLTFVIISSGLSKVHVFLAAQRRVLSMANFTGSVRVLRNGAWTLLSTVDLVPGDVIEVASSDHVFPVDAVLIDGGAVCDESSLTGEALPVVKFAVKNDADLIYRKDDSFKNNNLYAGCFILEAQASTRGRPVLALVTATGATTSKGKLVKDILFPMQISFVFNEHLKVVFPILIGWGIIMLLLSMFFMGSIGADSWFYGMFTISQVLSPLLPAVLVIGQSVACDRLAKKGILCVDLDRITLSGKIKVYCFDKTGTLTREGLNYLGVQPLLQTATSKPQFGSVINEFSRLPVQLRVAMMTCHSVSMVGDQPVGNFVDIEMFSATNAELSRAVGEDQEELEISGGTFVYPRGNGDHNLIIVKRFEFVHSNAYMTVLVRDPVDNKLYVYLKGSFEKIQEICDPSSLPTDAQDMASFHASEGCYVLGFARRELHPSISLLEATTMARSSLENGGIQFLGLCLFRNELKPDTAEALEELRDGGCRVVMITGDNVNTGVFVAKRCGMIRATEYGEPVILVGDLDPRDETQVVWTHKGNKGEQNKIVTPFALNTMIMASRAGTHRPLELAVTGKAFNVLLQRGQMRDLLFETRIFARMSPDDKVMCVRLHMEKAITAMCGDGGNDAGALKAAHSGIALSEAESSVVAHFSSRERSLFSCVELLREARCALDISFASYKYLIMYGEILALLGLLQYYFTVNMSQFMWVVIDGTTVPLSWALTKALPAQRLARTRPTARLLGPETVISIVGQIIINVIFGIIAVAMLFGERDNNGWFKCKEFYSQFVDLRKWWELADNFEGEVTGIVIVFQIVHSAAVNNIGNVYRSGFWRNRVFLAIYSSIVVLLSALTLANPNTISCLFRTNCGTKDALLRLNSETGTNYATEFLGIPSSYYSFEGHNVMPYQFRVRLWLLCMVNLIVLVLFQWVFVLGLGRKIAKARWPLTRLEYRT
ncbi:hypothetical protein BDR26DRAFT_858611 [Obelidium mucronatum]|nr:hypothetical protein BDR26DRAFT_858611 [Obelidium mucronatum]